MNQLVNEGPKHKQVLTALLLNSSYELLKTIEKSTETLFVLQEGFELIDDDKDEEIAFPVSIPLNLGTNVNKAKIIEEILQAPKHELLAYAMAIQVIEWAIKASVKTEIIPALLN